MDSSIRLDYAVFQLTPTRTRCDLVLVAGNKNEKLASGLLEPFLSHLKYAKDQSSKGGYSISLKPSSSDVSWFTKATFERFVRFVRTPELLERFVTIEKEIAQIESSVQSTEQANGVFDAEGLKNAGGSSKFNARSDGRNNPEQEDNTKVRLQRVLETRKTALRKEQAMAYARALVAGFEIIYIDDLLCFADAFGALRLREACVNFMDLCNKKNEDRIWRDEVAAMQAFSNVEYPYLGTSGVLLAEEDNPSNRDITMNAQLHGLYGKNRDGLVDASASDSNTSHENADVNQGNGFPAAASMHFANGKDPLPAWANHPQYMPNHQGPIFPHMAPYQGYYFRPPSLYSGMHNLQRYDSVSNSQSDVDDHEDHRSRHSTFEQTRTRKKGKNSSRKVVIRNINYISSKRRSGETDSSSDDSTGEDEYINAESLKHQVEEAVGSIGRHHKSTSRSTKRQDGGHKHGHELDITAIDQDAEKVVPTDSGETNENWNMFQSLLLKDAEKCSGEMEFEQAEEKCFSTKRSDDEQISSAPNLGSEEPLKRNAVSVDPYSIEESHTGKEGDTNKRSTEIGEDVCPIIRRRGLDDEIFSQNVEQPRNVSHIESSGFVDEAPFIKRQKEENWMTFNQEGNSADQGREDLTSYVGPASALVYDNQQGQKLKKDLVDDSLMVQDRSIGALHESQKTDILTVSDVMAADQSKYSIPDNLHEKVESQKSFEPDDLYVVFGRQTSVDQVTTSWNPGMDYVNENDAVQKRSDMQQSDSVDKVTRTKNSSGKAAGETATARVTKSKAAAASHLKSKSEITTRSKKATLRNRTVTQKIKSEKEEENRKNKEELLIQRQKRISERSAANGPNTLSSRRNQKESKPATVQRDRPKLQDENPKKTLEKPIMRSSTIERLSAARSTYKLPSDEPKAGKTKKVVKKESGLSSQHKTAVTQKKKRSVDNVNLENRRSEPADSNGCSHGRDDYLDVAAAMPNDFSGLKENQHSQKDNDSQNIKELLIGSAVEKKEGEIISEKVERRRSQGASMDLCFPADVRSAQSQFIEGHNEELIKASSAQIGAVSYTCVAFSNSADFQTSPKMVDTQPDENGMDKMAFSVPEKSETENFTPPPENDMNPDLGHSRKKWNSGENSPKFTKGIRRLLLFGRRS